MKERMIQIGNRLSKEREKAGYSQEAFAEQICVCAITVSRWENGHTPMKASDIIKVAEKLNISADYLLGIEKIEANLADMLADLNSSGKQLILATIKTMIENLKG